MNNTLLQQQLNVLSYNEAIQESLTAICSPFLARFKIRRFWYGKFIMDKDMQALGFQCMTTNLSTLKDYMYLFGDNGLDFTNAIKKTPLNSISYFVWPSTSKCPILNLFKEKHGIVKGFTIYKRHFHYIEAWCFSTDSEGYLPTIINSDILALFKQFIGGFYKNMSKIPNLEMPLVNYPTLINMKFDDPLVDIKTLMSQFQRADYNIYLGDKSINCSPREWSCFELYGQGKTHKEIGRILSISPRTSEEYINRLKGKTGCVFKTEIIDLYQKHKEKNNNE